MSFFFFNDTATTEIYTLSLHDALPISQAVLPRREGAAGAAPRHGAEVHARRGQAERPRRRRAHGASPLLLRDRSEEHTSELQSRQYLVCRLLLEKKNTNISSTFLSILT